MRKPSHTAAPVALFPREHARVRGRVKYFAGEVTFGRLSTMHGLRLSRHRRLLSREEALQSTRGPGLSPPTTAIGGII